MSEKLKQHRVLVFVGHLQRGGSYSRLRMLIEALLEEGVEVHYLAAKELTLPSHPRLVKHVPALRFKRRRGFRYRLTYSTLFPVLLLFLLLRNRFGAVIVFDPRFAALSKLPALLSRTPLVLFLRAIPAMLAPNPSSDGPLTRLWDYWGVFGSNKIVVTTNTMREELTRERSAFGSRVQTIPSGVIYPRGVGDNQTNWIGSTEWQRWLQHFPERRDALAERLEIPERNVILATGGQLTREKNVEHLVRALGASGSERATLIICGDGPEAKRIFSLAVGYGLSEQVLMPGWIDNLIDVVSGCDLFIMPSMSLDIPNSVMEALGAGIGVIAADTPAMRELLANEELLFDPAHVGNFADRISYLLSHRGALERIRTLSQERARALDVAWEEGMVRLITEVVES